MLGNIRTKEPLRSNGRHGPSERVTKKPTPETREEQLFEGRLSRRLAQTVTLTLADKRLERTAERRARSALGR